MAERVVGQPGLWPTWKPSPLTSPPILHPNANTVTRKIVTLTRTLGEFPLSGRKVPEFDDENIRELIAYSFRIIYRVDGAIVTLAVIVHGKRILE